MTDCPRCLPNRPCLNCDLEAARIARLKAKDKEEAIAIGRERLAFNLSTGRISFRTWREA